MDLKINGADHQVDVPDDMPLLWVVRDVIGLTGTKFGCGIAQCGACTVHLDGVAIRSCQLPVGAVGGRAITTIEGVGETPAGAKIQKAWLDLEVIQCGYCQPGYGIARRQSAARRRGDRRGDGGQSLPLRHLCADPRGDQTCRSRLICRAVGCCRAAGRRQSGC